VVEWIHADPVSGSSTRVNKDGTEYYRTEYEPLGNQEVHTAGNQDDYPEPPSPTEPAGTKADDPQWMCTLMYNDEVNWSVPTSCGLAALADVRNWYGAWGKESHETGGSAPSGIGHVAGARPSGTSSTSGIIPVNMSSTNKLQSGSATAGSIPAASIPFDGGSLETETVPNQWTVTVMDNTVPGFIDTEDEIKKLPSSLTDAPKQKHPNLKSLKTDFEAALKVDNGSGTCLEKLDALLKQLKIENKSGYSSIEKVGKEFLTGNPKLYETLEPVPFLKSKIDGKWTKIQNRLAGATTYDGRQNQIVLNKSASGKINNLIHELIHAAGKNFAYEENVVTAAIFTLEKEKMGINSFIGKYCTKKEVPKE
jgi:hypothetical protein